MKKLRLLLLLTCNIYGNKLDDYLFEAKTCYTSQNFVDGAQLYIYALNIALTEEMTELIHKIKTNLNVAIDRLWEEKQYIPIISICGQINRIYQQHIGKSLPKIIQLQAIAMYNDAISTESIELFDILEIKRAAKMLKSINYHDLYKQFYYFALLKCDELLNELETNEDQLLYTLETEERNHEETYELISQIQIKKSFASGIRQEIINEGEFPEYLSDSESTTSIDTI